MKWGKDLTHLLAEFPEQAKSRLGYLGGEIR